MSLSFLRPLSALHPSYANPRPDITTLSTYDIAFELEPSANRCDSKPPDSTGDAHPSLEVVAAIAGPLSSAIAGLVPGVRRVFSLVAYGGWNDDLAPSCTVRLRTTGDRALAVAAAIGLAAVQDEVLVTSSRVGRTAALDVAFLDDQSVGDLASQRDLWAACRLAADGRLTGFSPLRFRHHDGIRILDVDHQWGSTSEAARWVLSAAASAGRRVAVSPRFFSASMVQNDWSHDVLGEGFTRRLIASGRGAVASDAGRQTALIAAGLKRDVADTNTCDGSSHGPLPGVCEAASPPKPTSTVSEGPPCLAPQS